MIECYFSILYNLCSIHQLFFPILVCNNWYFYLYSWVSTVHSQQQRTLHPKFWMSPLFCQSKILIAQTCAQSVLWPPYPYFPDFISYYTSLYFNLTLLALTSGSTPYVSALGALHWWPVLFCFVFLEWYPQPQVSTLLSFKFLPLSSLLLGLLSCQGHLSWPWYYVLLSAFSISTQATLH